MPDLIELRDVAKVYPRLPEPVLTKINLRISAGERLVLLGTSGSGKTTLLHLLGLLLQPDKGSVLLGTEDTTTWSERKRAKWRRNNLGYVFQDFGLIPELTLLENVLLPLRINGKLDEQMGKILLAQVGLDGRKNFFPSEVSGGEAQRTAIARALVNKPRLVLADEPTGNLQQQQGEQIAHLFLQLQKELGFALVVATHNEILANSLEAQILRLSGGNLLPSEREEK